MINDIIYFAKTNPNAIIPSKRDEDGGFDLYSCFQDDCIIIPPFQSKLIPIGIASAFSDDYVILLRERGSTGTKNIKINAGVIDSGYRDSWFVSLYNGNDKPVAIVKNNSINNIHWKVECIIYPYEKAIAQAILLPVPKTKVKEITYRELTSIPSKRGMGALGSSGK